MAAGDSTSSDVPEHFDVAINGKGYMLLKSIEPSLPFRTHRAIYSSTDTFVERSNITGQYGDDKQDFFLTVAQHDWSLGEQQRFLIADDPDSTRRYYAGRNVDVSVPGQVTISQASVTTSIAGTITAVSKAGGYLGQTTSLMQSSALYPPTFANRGAHGLGGAPTSIVTDPAGNAYIANAANGIRKWNGSSFSAFATSGADSLAFLNNTLYGYRVSTASLYQWDTSGNLTSLFTWKGADGSTATGTTAVVCAHAKTIVVANSAEGSVWQYDGTSTTKLFAMPPNFVPEDACSVQGILLISGHFYGGDTDTNSPPSYSRRDAVLYQAAGTTGILWQNELWKTATPQTAVPVGCRIAAFAQGAIWISQVLTGSNPGAAVSFIQWDAATGGVRAVGDLANIAWNGSSQLGTSPNNGYVVFGQNASGPTFWNLCVWAPAENTPGISFGTAYLDTSMMDFGNTLTKTFRSAKIDADIPVNTSINISYQVNGTGTLDGSYTSLANSVTSGTEYLFPAGTSGRNISLELAMSSTMAGVTPKLKRIYVRAAPQLQSYKQRQYVLDLSGIGIQDNVILNDGLPHPLSGHEQAENLIAAITATAPFAISDRFTNRQTSLNGSTTSDTFTGVCEPAECEIYDTRTGSDNSQYPGAFVAKITVREV